MKDVALFLAGAGSMLAAVLYVIALKRQRPSVPCVWSERDFGEVTRVPEDAQW